MENNVIYDIKNKFVSCYEKGLSATINLKLKDDDILDSNPSIENQILILSGEIYNDDIISYDNFMVNMDSNKPVSTKKGFAYFYEDLNIPYVEFIELIRNIYNNFEITSLASPNYCIGEELYYLHKILREEVSLKNLNFFVESWNENFSNKLFKIKFHRAKNYYKAFVTFAYDDIYTDNIGIEFIEPLDKVLPEYSRMDYAFESNNNAILRFEDSLHDNNECEKGKYGYDRKTANQIIINNVGQGNFIEVEKDNSIFAFDIGLGRWLTKNSRMHWKSYIRKRKYDNIFISHLHWDHYALITYLKDDQFDCNWYISDKGNKPAYAYRYLDEIKTKSNGKLNCYNSSGFISSGAFNSILWKLYQGEIISPANKLVNGGGLILKLIYEDRKYLFTGDCDYKYIPKEAKDDKLTLLIIPHHGAKQEQISSYNDMKAADNNAYAIVSVGKNTYGHPTVSHIVNIFKRGFEVCSTHDNGTIVLDLDTNKLYKEK